jgi:hypothetical protein
LSSAHKHVVWFVFQQSNTHNWVIISGDEEPRDPLVPQSSQTGLNLIVQDQRGVVQDPKEQFISQVQTKLIAAKARGQGMFEPCLVVTSNGVFVLKCARDPVTTFLECAMQVKIRGDCM